MEKTNPFRVRDIVRVDGRIGKRFEIVAIADHEPKDGPRTKNAICYLHDGSWEFYWNLSLIGRYSGGIEQ